MLHQLTHKYLCLAGQLYYAVTLDVKFLKGCVVAIQKIPLSAYNKLDTPDELRQLIADSLHLFLQFIQGELFNLLIRLTFMKEQTDFCPFYNTTGIQAFLEGSLQELCVALGNEYSFANFLT